MKLGSRPLALAIMLAMVAAACGDDGGSSGAADPDVAPDEVAADVVASIPGGDASVDGVVTRTVPVSEDGDGRGQLHLTLDTQCRNDRGTGVEPLTTVGTGVLSLAEPDDEITFRFEGLADGTYFASGWLDDVDNEEQDEDLPATGDLVMFGDLSPRCDEFEVVDGEADDLRLELDYEMPFTLPGLSRVTRGSSRVATSPASTPTRSSMTAPPTR